MCVYFGPDVSNRFHRYAAVVSASAFLALAGCSDDPATENDHDENGHADVGQTDTGVDDAGTTDDTGDTGSVDDAGDEGDAGGEDTGYDTGGDAGGDEPPELAPNEPGLAVFTDPLWVKHGVFGEWVEVDCQYLDDWRVPADDQPDDIEIEVEDYYEVNDDGLYRFAEAGSYSVTCTSESLDEETSGDIVVAYEGVAFSHVEVMEVLSELDMLWEEFYALLAEDEPDEDELEDALVALEEVAAELEEFDGDEELLIDFPQGQWPEVSDLVEEGFDEGPDDEQWLDAIDEMQDAQEPFRDALAGLSLDATDDEIEALHEELAAIQQLRQQLEELEPSEVVMYEYRDQMPALMAEIAESARFEVEVIAGLMREEPVAAPNASIVGQLGTMAVKSVISKYSFKGWYKDTLTDVGRSIAVSFMSMGFTQWWNDFNQPQPNAPILESVHGPWANSVCAGQPMTAYGTFNGDYEQMSILFLPPSSLYPITKLYDAGMAMWSLWGDIEDMLATGATINDLLSVENQIEDILDTLHEAQNPNDGQWFLELKPESGDDTFLEFAPLPNDPELNTGIAPAGGSMFPLDRHFGFGDAIDVNVHPGTC